MGILYYVYILLLFFTFRGRKNKSFYLFSNKNIISTDFFFICLLSPDLFLYTFYINLRRPVINNIPQGLYLFWGLLYIGFFWRPMWKKHRSRQIVPQLSCYTQKRIVEIFIYAFSQILKSCKNFMAHWQQMTGPIPYTIFFLLVQIYVLFITIYRKIFSTHDHCK